MIQVTLQFDNIPEAHAALGNMMARMTTVAPASDAPSPAVVAAAAADAMELVSPEDAPKPKRKRGTGNPTGRPKGRKDGPDVVRKGTKKAAEGLTLDVLRERLQAYSDKHGFKAARDLLAQHNIKRLPELPEDRYFDFDRDMAKGAAA